MAKTITTHNGTAAHREHNVRNPKVAEKLDHIDSSLTKNNEILHDEKPREAYKRIFGEALANYNAKQSREDRKISDYYTHVMKDKKKNPVYEMIVQVGDRKDTGLDAPIEKQCLREFYRGWKERNPHLECIGAYIHADEPDGTVHMHLDYVPVATGYKKGMEIQNGLNKALEQQGFVKEGKRTAQIQWEARENATLESICERHGIEVVHTMRGEGKHIDTEIFKKQQQLKEIKQELEEYKELKVQVAEIDDIGKSIGFGYVSVKKEDFDLMKEQAKAYRSNRDELEHVHVLSKEIDERKAAIKAKEIEANQKLAQATKLQEQANQSYTNQLNLNRDHQLLKEENDRLKKEYEKKSRIANELGDLVISKDKYISSLETLNSKLETGLQEEMNKKLQELTTPLKDRIKALEESLSAAQEQISNLKTAFCEKIRDICKAIAVLKYGQDAFKVEVLTKKQSNLIEAILNHGADFVRNKGHGEAANEIDTKMGISPEISSEMKVLERQQKGHEWSR